MFGEWRVLKLRKHSALLIPVQSRSEETADLLAEKVRLSEEEAMLLTRKAKESESEVQRMRIAALKVQGKGGNT